jgi:transcriptional regulator with XRE-family HTH domain
VWIDDILDRLVTTSSAGKFSTLKHLNNNNGKTMTRFDKDLFKTMRKLLRFSQYEIAEKLGVTQKRVSRWELGTTSPDKRELHKIAVFASSYSQVGYHGAYNITGLDNVYLESVPELKDTTKLRIVLIEYKTCIIEWQPYELHTLEAISNTFEYIENIQIIERSTAL